MSYNLLLDTEFKDNNIWKLTNCYLDDNKLISTDRVFGIYQELILPDITKVYFRIQYQIENNNYVDVKIGIENKDGLFITRKCNKKNRWQKISIVEDSKQEKIKLHLIFESKEKSNIVNIKNPMLIDLNQVNKSTWTKFRLDNQIQFRKGYNYQNIYKDSELKPNIDDFKAIYCEQGAIGSIFTEKDKLQIELNAKFISNKYYLVKLDYKEINKFGNIYITYGVLKSSYYEDEQLYLLFKANENTKLYLHIQGNDILPYQINLKHLLIIKAGEIGLIKEDIPYLPFI